MSYRVLYLLLALIKQKELFYMSLVVRTSREGNSRESLHQPLKREIVNIQPWEKVDETMLERAEKTIALLGGTQLQGVALSRDLARPELIYAVGGTAHIVECFRISHELSRHIVDQYAKGDVFCAIEQRLSCLFLVEDLRGSTEIMQVLPHHAHGWTVKKYGLIGSKHKIVFKKGSILFLPMNESNGVPRETS